MENVPLLSDSPEMRQILSARQALRILDYAINRTEMRLRRLKDLVPSSSGGDGGGGGGPRESMPGQRTTGRGLLRTTAVGTTVRGLSQGFKPRSLLSSGVGAGPIMALILATEAAANGAEAAREAKAMGGNLGDQIAEAGARVLNTIGTPVTGAAGWVGSLMERFGIAPEGYAERLRKLMDASNLTISGRQRHAAEIEAARKVGADIRKKHAEAWTNLYAWLPQDFEVADDATRQDLLRQLIHWNEAKISSDLSRSMFRYVHGKPARDSSGD